MNSIMVVTIFCSIIPIITAQYYPNVSPILPQCYPNVTPIHMLGCQEVGPSKMASREATTMQP